MWNRENSFFTVRAITLTVAFINIKWRKTWLEQRRQNFYVTLQTKIGPVSVYNVFKALKGTQNWEFFCLRFWNLHYFFVSYVKILRFYKKKNFDWPVIGGGTIFPRSPRTTQNEKKKFWVRSKFFYFFFSFVNPFYEPILVFPKFDQITAPGMALRVNLGPKCQHLFPLVWD